MSEDISMSEDVEDLFNKMSHFCTDKTQQEYFEKELRLTTQSEPSYIEIEPNEEMVKKLIKFKADKKEEYKKRRLKLGYVTHFWP